MCDVQFTHKASGKKIKNHFYWEEVTWKKCSCGLVHSNRSIPPEFWKRKWVKKAKREKVGIMIIKEDKISFSLLKQSFRFINSNVPTTVHCLSCNIHMPYHRLFTGRRLAVLI